MAEPILLLALITIIDAGTAQLGKKAVDAFFNLGRAYRAEGKRLAAFRQAYADGQAQLLVSRKLAEETATQVNAVLQVTQDDIDADSDVLREYGLRLADGIQNNVFFHREPDVTELSSLMKIIATRSGRKMPADEQLSQALLIFIQEMQRSLAKTAEFGDQMRRLERYWATGDSRARYLNQMAAWYRNLDLVGIPGPKQDHNTMRLTDIFVQLQAELEISDRQKKDDGLEMHSVVGEGLTEHLKDSQTTKKRLMSINQALNERQHLVILGDPGAGKTVLLQYITVAFAEGAAKRRLDLDESRMPIFIRLYDFAEKWSEHTEGFDFIDYLRVHAKENLSLRNLPEGFFAEALDNGLCCICLDGLDELRDSALRRQVSKKVGAFARRYPRNRIIITSRLVGYYEAPLERQEFEHITIQPYSDEDVEAYVEKWYACREQNITVRKEYSTHLIKAIKKQPAIRQLATNPLLLTIIGLVHRTEAELPLGRAKLYEQCVTVLIDTWDEAKPLHAEDHVRPYYRFRRRLLEQLAFWMQEQGKSEIKQGTLQTLLSGFLLQDIRLDLTEEEALQEAGGFIKYSKTRMGLLVERGDGRYGFMHLTFQEYLAAAEIRKRYLFKSEDGLWAEMTKENRLHDPRWRETILLLMGSLNGYDELPSMLTQRLLQQMDQIESVLPRNLFLAANILADGVDVEPDLEQTIIDRLLAVARSAGVASTDAFTALSRQKQSAFAGIGLLALAHSDSATDWTRLYAARVIAQLGPIEDAAHILLSFAQATNMETAVRRYATVYLGQLGHNDETIISGLLALAHNINVHYFIRREVISILGQLDHTTDETIFGLKTIAQDADESESVRLDAASALGQLGQIDVAAELLLAVAQETDSDRICHITAITLGQFGYSDDAAHLLLTLAQDATVSNIARYDAVEALGQLGHADAKVISTLITIAQDIDEMSTVPIAAASALKQLGYVNEAVQLLLDLIQNNKVDFQVHQIAVRKLGSFESTKVTIFGLNELVQNNDISYNIRRYATEMLGRFGQVDDLTVSNLRVIALDENESAMMRVEAAVALAQLGPIEDALEILLIAAQDITESASVRTDAATALAQLGRPKDAAKCLLAVAQDIDTSAAVRCEAAKSLSQFGLVDEAAQILLVVAQDYSTQFWIRNSAIHHLSQLGYTDETVLAALLTLSQKTKLATSIRGAAIQALGQLGLADNTVVSGLLSLILNAGLPDRLRDEAYASLKLVLRVTP